MGDLPSRHPPGPWGTRVHAGAGSCDRRFIPTPIGNTRATSSGPHSAIVPEVSGTAHITGRNELYLDPNDQLGRGFNFR
ncbi:proline racemase family protein [Steroidobacter flavus]|uniref:Proline racemase family protein n=1 Tax=Steroidobacter flavus TaxID=1842136 RepID=A0ABV8SMR7_9GAMM